MEALIFIIAWGICGVACYSIAQGKNRNPVTWFWVGVLLGIIGVIIISAMPPL